MTSTAHGGTRRAIGVLAAGLLALFMCAVTPLRSDAAGYTTACDGASEQAGAFVDAGLAADCLKMYGVALGKADGSFGENDSLIRSQVSSLLARLVQLAGASLSQRHSFPDVNSDTVPNNQVRDEIELLAGSGIIAGFPDGTFGPTVTLTVAQAATLVIRALAFIHAQNPNAYDVQDQGSTTDNYNYAVQITVLDLSASDVHGSQYPTQPTDATERGLLADMVAVSIESLVDRGVVANRSPIVTFGDGQYRVGSDVPAGTYRATDTSQGCYWERESGFSGSFDEIIANDFAFGGPEIVTIDPSDAGFKSDDCLHWSNNLAALKSPSSPIPDGMWQVGKEVSPGTYSASPSANGDHCYWARLSGFSGELDDINANGISDSSQIVTVMSTDVGFQSSNCTDWVPT